MNLRSSGKGSFGLELRRQFAHAAFGSLLLLPALLLERLAATALMMSVVFLLIALAGYRWHRENFHRHIFLEQLYQLESWIERQILRLERPGDFPQRGAVCFSIGALLAYTMFPLRAAAAAIAVLALADAVSTIIGKFYGKHKLPVNRQKSWEGSAAFFIGALAVLLFFTNPLKALGVALFATVVEMAPDIDDNLTVPLAVGLAMSLL